MITHLSAPNDAVWDVTYRCNLRCKHCYVSGGRSTDELSTEEAEKVISQLAESKVFTLSMTGGEPLLREDILELIEYSKKLDLVTILASNGWFIDGKTAHSLKSAGLNSVLLSIDGQNPETHDYIRGQGSFEKVIEAGKNLREVGIPFGFTLVLNKMNYREIEETALVVKSLGANQLRLYRLLNAGRGKELPTLHLTPQEIRETIEKVQELRIGTNIVFDEAFGFLSSCQTNRSITYPGCSAARTIVGIKASGEVTPCPMMTDTRFYAGSLLNQNFKDIWTSSPVLNFFRTLPRLNGKCANCYHLSRCGGGCRVAAYDQLGDILASDPGCWFAPEEEH